MFLQPETPAIKRTFQQEARKLLPVLLLLISLRLQLCRVASGKWARGGIQMYKLVKNADTLVGRLEQEKPTAASLSSLQRASQLATNCLALTSRTFLSTNEAGGRRGERECVCHLQLQCWGVCVFQRQKAERRSGDLMESGPQLFFSELFGILWKECVEGITLLAATVTFQWGSTLSSPLSNPRWNGPLCKMKMRPEMKWPARLLRLHGRTCDGRNWIPLGPKMKSCAWKCTGMYVVCRVCYPDTTDF